jgi:hypothetical protein
MIRYTLKLTELGVSLIFMVLCAKMFFAHFCSELRRGSISW